MEETSFVARVADAMYSRDRAANALGIVLEEVRFGYARMRMTVTEQMLNGHDIAHGGYTFLLADTVFAYACNSRNASNVALACSITFNSAVRAGEALLAVCEERVRSKKTGTYDVTIYGPDERVVALFRGTCYQLNSTVIRY